MKLDWKLTVATIATTLLPMMSYYGRNLLPEPYNRLLYYFVIPFLLLRLMGWKARDHGLTIGKWREGVLWVAAVCAIIRRRGREQRGRNNFITKVGVLQCSGFLVGDIHFLSKKRMCLDIRSAGQVWAISLKPHSKSTKN